VTGDGDHIYTTPAALAAFKALCTKQKTNGKLPKPVSGLIGKVLLYNIY